MVTRRQFLISGGAVLLPRVVRFSGLRELRRGVGMFLGMGGTIGWFAGRGGALLVDSQTRRRFAAASVSSENEH